MPLLPQSNIRKLTCTKLFGYDKYWENPMGYFSFAPLAKNIFFFTFTTTDIPVFRCDLSVQLIHAHIHTNHCCVTNGVVQSKQPWSYEPARGGELINILFLSVSHFASFLTTFCYVPSSPRAWWNEIRRVNPISPSALYLSVFLELLFWAAHPPPPPPFSSYYCSIINWELPAGQCKATGSLWIICFLHGLINTLFN